MFLLFGAFVAGMLTVLAPCVLPLLPVIIGGSVSGDTKNYQRPIVITASLAISLFVFTLLLKATTVLIGVPPESFAYISGAIIVLLGVFTLLPGVYAKIINTLGIEQRAQKTLSKGITDKRQLVGPAITGAALGPVFSSCSPVYAYILATVLPANFGQAMVYITVYILGLSAVLLAIGVFGQRFIRKIKFASDPRGWFQRGIAVLFIVVGLMVFTGFDKQFQTYVSTNTPFNFDKLSAQLLPESQNKTNGNRLFNVVEPYDAPEFVGLENWINSKPLTMSELEGNVVYVDFWTYSCINCIRNNPYIEQWYQAYKDDGFVVVAVHAPEFSFERLPKNVQKAVDEQGLSYPVALDNDFATWNAYNNQSWPAGYLIDAEGKVRRIHEGEGKYAESEEAIRALLLEKGAVLDGRAMTSKQNLPISARQTPETYLGKSRASNYVGEPAIGAANATNFSHSTDFDANDWSLGGQWDVEGERITAAGANSTLKIKVSAKDVYLVGSSEQPQRVELYINGKPVGQTQFAGNDVTNNYVTFGEARLYRLLDFGQFKQGQLVELRVPQGVSLNAFTFGS